MFFQPFPHRAPTMVFDAVIQSLDPSTEQTTTMVANDLKCDGNAFDGGWARAHAARRCGCLSFDVGTTRASNMTIITPSVVRNKESSTIQQLFSWQFCVACSLIDRLRISRKKASTQFWRILILKSCVSSAKRRCTLNSRQRFHYTYANGPWASINTHTRRRVWVPFRCILIGANSSLSLSFSSYGLSKHTEREFICWKRFCNGNRRRNNRKAEHLRAMCHLSRAAQLIALYF